MYNTILFTTIYYVMHDFTKITNKLTVYYKLLKKKSYNVIILASVEDEDPTVLNS